jgi:isopenicillin N synthase-like dioxygenase
LSAAGVDALQQLYDKEVGVAKLIARALSSQFTCTEGGNTLARVAEGGEHISLMRLFHYFNQGSEEVQRHLQGATDASAQEHAMLGSSLHTDWGFLTVILADEVGGLQFIPRGGDVRSEADWVDVPYIPGSLIINGGDYLSLISKGVYHSPIHRVLTPGSRGTQAGAHTAVQAVQAVDGTSEPSNAGAVGSRDRYSFVLFFYPAYESPVSPDVLGHCTHTSSISNNNNCNNNDSGSARDGGSKGAQAGPSQERVGAAANGPASALSYNTLLALDGERPRSFGDYVIRKWEGVYRAG